MSHHSPEIEAAFQKAHGRYTDYANQIHECSIELARAHRLSGFELAEALERISEAEYQLTSGCEVVGYLAELLDEQLGLDEDGLTAPEAQRVMDAYTAETGCTTIKGDQFAINERLIAAEKARREKPVGELIFMSLPVLLPPRNPAILASIETARAMLKMAGYRAVDRLATHGWVARNGHRIDIDFDGLLVERDPDPELANRVFETSEEVVERLKLEAEQLEADSVRYACKRCGAGYYVAGPLASVEPCRCGGEIVEVKQLRIETYWGIRLSTGQEYGLRADANSNTVAMVMDLMVDRYRQSCETVNELDVVRQSKGSP